MNDETTVRSERAMNGETYSYLRPLGAQPMGVLLDGSSATRARRQTGIETKESRDARAAILGEVQRRRDLWRRHPFSTGDHVKLATLPDIWRGGPPPPIGMTGRIVPLARRPACGERSRRRLRRAGMERRYLVAFQLDPGQGYAADTIIEVNPWHLERVRIP